MSGIGAVALFLLMFPAGCNLEIPALVDSAGQQILDPQPDKSTAILLVSHGSHSSQWRASLLAVEEGVRNEALSCDHIGEIRSAFMEYNEPSIATRLREFDELGYSRVVVIPLLLTVSSHSFDDIPTIAGLKEDRMATETLQLEGVEIYKARAQVEIAPLLDFKGLLEKNAVRRVKELSENPAEEGVVLVAYGSEQYNEEWTSMLEHIGAKLEEELGIDSCHYAWCGHIARYKSDLTAAAIKQVLEEKKNAIVIPVLVAVDETFQGRIIGGAVRGVDAGDRVRYRHDAILPDENVRQWIIDVCQDASVPRINQPTTQESS